MNPETHVRLAAVAVMMVLAIGVLDATIGGEWDLLAVLVIAGALQLVVVTSVRPGRQVVPIRGDLVRWARERAQRGGEPVGVVLDRAVAHARDHYGDAPQEARR